jgi:hypothetical protein
MLKGTTMAIRLVILFIVSTDILLLPAIIWGWIRWIKQEKPRSLISYLAAVDFAFATASALLAVSAIIYANHIGGFPFYDPRLLRIYRWGAVLSLTGIAFAIGGVWKPGPLRWLAPACTVGTLLYWFGAAAGG